VNGEREQYRSTYRFPSLERRGLASGLRPTQVLILACASVVAVALFRRIPTAVGFVGAIAIVLCAGAVTWLPVRERGADEWLPVVAGWLWLQARGRRHLSLTPQAGTTVRLPTGSARPLARGVGKISLRGLELADGGEVGVLADDASGTRTALLAIRVRSFALLAAREQERRLVRWGRAVASLARTGSPVRRLQVLERTLPHDEDELRRWLDSARDASFAAGHPLVQSYESLVDAAADVTQDHEVVIALQVDARRVRRGDIDGVLLRELRNFADQLDGADAGIVGALSAEDCGRLLRTGFDPFGGATAGLPLEPTATEPTWDLLRTDGVLHRSYWVAQWPRLQVGPAFLGPLLLTTTAVRSLSVVVEPVPPDRSRRAVEVAITSDEADEQLRRERGFRTSARRRTQQAAALRREEELAEGHEEVRFAGYVTVSGRDREELDRNCDDVLQAAQQAYLDLQPMWGQQDQGFVCGALPLCHGLAPAGLIER
jgi:hypothetical protein